MPLRCCLTQAAADLYNAAVERRAAAFHRSQCERLLTASHHGMLSRAMQHPAEMRAHDER